MVTYAKENVDCAIKDGFICPVEKVVTTFSFAVINAKFPAHRNVHLAKSFAKLGAATIDVKENVENPVHHARWNVVGDARTPDVANSVSSYATESRVTNHVCKF